MLAIIGCAVHKFQTAWVPLTLLNQDGDILGAAPANGSERYPLSLSSAAPPVSAARHDGRRRNRPSRNRPALDPRSALHRGGASSASRGPKSRAPVDDVVKAFARFVGSSLNRVGRKSSSGRYGSVGSLFQFTISEISIILYSLRILASVFTDLRNVSDSAASQFT